MHGNSESALRERNGQLLRWAVEAGNRSYDPAEGLLKQSHVYPDYNGYVIAQAPVEYAIALLETAGPESGWQVERANDIIRRTLRYQDRDPNSPTYGNFYWMAHWEQVKDRNAVSFMTPNYAYLWQQHRPQLDGETQRALGEMFPLALRGLRAHQVAPRYTNIFLLNLLGKLMLGQILAEPTTQEEALADWAAWVEQVSTQGIAEYNSPCYTPVDLYALAGIWQAAPTATFRAQVERMLEYLWAEFCLNYHPGAELLSGPMSRAYPWDYRTGTGLSAVLAYQHFGIARPLNSNGGTTPFIVNFATKSYVLPEAIRALALDKDYPLDVRGTLPGREIATHNHLERTFALGSQTGRYGVQEIPLFLAYQAPWERRTLFFQSEPPLATLSSAQQGSVVCGGWFYAPDLPWERYGPEARASAAVLGVLGEAATIQGIWLEGVSPSGLLA